MSFELFRSLQHDIRRISPKRMCYYRFLLTNTFCIQQYGCVLLAQIIQMSKGSGFSSDVNLCLFRIVSYCFSYFCWFFRICQFHFVFPQVISYSISYMYARQTKMNNSHGLYFVFCISYGFRMYFVRISYCFVCFSYFVVSRILM